MQYASNHFPPKAEATGSNPVGCTNFSNDLGDNSGSWFRGLSAVCPLNGSLGSWCGDLPAYYRPTETKIAAPAGTGNGDEIGGTYKLHRGQAYRRTGDPASRLTHERVRELAARLRLEKSPTARVAWALAALLSLEKEDRAALIAVLKPAPAREVAE
jgi:hypothetical protein